MLKSRIYFLLSVIIMVIIFAFSSVPSKASNAESNIIAKPISNVIKQNTKKTFEDEKAQKDYFKKIDNAVSKFVRKSAHAFLFALLAFCVFGFITSIGKSEYTALCLTLAFCLLYAAGDEMHQRFTSRLGRFEDVCIDLFGAVIMMFLVFAVNKAKQLCKRKTK